MRRLLLPCLAALACGHPAPAPAPEKPAPAAACAGALCDAEALMYRVLGGEKELRGEALAKLRAVVESEPRNGRARLFLGMTLLSGLAEENDPKYLADIEPTLVAASRLLPDDRRIPGWLGVYRVRLAATLGDEKQLAEAIAFMEKAAADYPDFNNVSLAIAFSGLPLHTGYPKKAVEALEQIKDCAARDERCRNTAKIPHNVEGALMLFGDVHARQGDRERALAFYRQALASPDAQSWRFRARAEEYVAHIDERLAGFAKDSGPLPQFFSEGDTSCVGCHGK